MFYFALIIAGGLGALARYAVGRSALTLGWVAVPYGTLIANLLGCFLMGYFSWALMHKWQASNDVQVIVLSGFLGGFTTFSAFSLETVTMLQQGAELKTLAYILMTVVLCILMCFLGLILAKQT